MIERLLDHLSDSEIDSETIEKLRSFILDLATRGKLVPQNPDDENADVLLEQIKVNKERLVEAGEIPKPKALPPIELGNVPFETPPSWFWEKLGIVSNRIHYGYTESTNMKIRTNRFLRISDIQNNCVNWDTVPGCEISNKDLDKFALSEGDIVIARTGGTVGKSYLISGAEGLAVVFASYLIRVAVPDGINNHYLKLVLESPLYWTQVIDKTSGMAQPNVNATSLSNLILPFPPLAEQHRIVEKVDELMQFLDDLEESLNTKDSILAVLRESILSELSEAEDYEALSEAFNRIAENAEQLFSKPKDLDTLRQTILELAIRGRLVTLDDADGIVEDISKIDEQLEEESPFYIPSGWIWTRLSNLALVNGGYAFKSSNYSTEGRRVVRISDFNENGIKDNNIVRHSYDQKLEKFTLSENDILMAMSGGTVGKSCLVKIIPEPMMVNQRVATIKITGNIMPDYMYIVIKSKLIQDVIDQAKNSTNDNISMGDIKDFMIPLPPFPTQQRIVQRVDYLLAICDQLGAGLMSQHTLIPNLIDSLMIETLEAM